MDKDTHENGSINGSGNENAPEGDDTPSEAKTTDQTSRLEDNSRSAGRGKGKNGAAGGEIADAAGGDAQRLMDLFAGNEDYHGTHGAPERDEEKGKWSIKSTAKTLRDRVTVLHWKQHLDGTRPIGIAPIRNDSTCWWGSIDIDDYNVVPFEVIAKIAALKYPLVPVRSKSGGLHLFMFLKAPEPATQVQTVLRDMVASLGHAGAEIFPKQTNLVIERGDQPNWICMPYLGTTFGGKLCEQAGLKRVGDMTLGEFLRAAESARTTTGEVKVKKSIPRSRTNGQHSAPCDPFGDGPPCLQHLVAAGGVPRGGQNNALLMMGIYYKRAFPDDWRAKLAEANNTLLVPPGTPDGLASVTKSLWKKDYEYTCKTEPMVSHCNAGVCRLRKFGVGDGGNFPRINSVIKLTSDEPRWLVTIEGSEPVMEFLKFDDIIDYRKFNTKCGSTLGRVFQPIKQPDWLTHLNSALQNMVEQEVDIDLTPAGEFQELLESFLTNRANSPRWIDLPGRKPFEDVEGEHGRHIKGAFYFEIRELMKHLSRQEFSATRPDCQKWIRALGGDHYPTTIKGTAIRLWWVPPSAVQRAPKLEQPEPQAEKI